METPDTTKKLIKGLFELSNKYKFSVSELAGASHSENSSHYLGISVDINELNGKHVGPYHPDAKEFIKDAKNIGLISNNEWKLTKGAHFHLTIKQK